MGFLCRNLENFGEFSKQSLVNNYVTLIKNTKLIIQRYFHNSWHAESASQSQCFWFPTFSSASVFSSTVLRAFCTLASRADRHSSRLTTRSRSPMNRLYLSSSTGRQRSRTSTCSASPRAVFSWTSTWRAPRVSSYERRRSSMYEANKRWKEQREEFETL